MLGDARDPAFCARACQGAEVVYHCLNVPYSAKAWAAELPTLQENLVTAARGARLVVFENLYMLGRSSTALTEQSPVAPISRKGQLRAQLSAALFDAHREGRVQVVAGRASHLVGPHVTQSQVGEHLFTRVLAGRSAQLMGNPDRLHSFSYAPDVGRALAELGLAAPDVLGKAHLLPVTPTMSARAFHQQLFAALGVQPKVEAVSRLLLSFIGLFAAPLRELVEQHYEWEHDYLVDDAAFRARFPDFTPTALDVALRETATWARATYGAAKAA
jgi:hypothetical protein